jgi:hypothetical protein
VKGGCPFSERPHLDHVVAPTRPPIYVTGTVGGIFGQNPPGPTHVKDGQSTSNFALFASTLGFPRWSQIKRCLLVVCSVCVCLSVMGSHPGPTASFPRRHFLSFGSLTRSLTSFFSLPFPPSYFFSSTTRLYSGTNLLHRSSATVVNATALARSGWKGRRDRRAPPLPFDCQDLQPLRAPLWSLFFSSIWVRFAFFPLGAKAQTAKTFLTRRDVELLFWKVGTLASPRRPLRPTTVLISASRIDTHRLTETGGWPMLEGRLQMYVGRKGQAG